MKDFIDKILESPELIALAGAAIAALSAALVYLAYKMAPDWFHPYMKRILDRFFPPKNVS